MPRRIGFGAQNLATAVSAMVLGLTMSASAATPLAWPDGWSDAFGNEAGIETGVGGIDSYTKLVLHADGTDGSVAVTDSSSAPHTVTVGGNVQIDTAQSKLGSGSLLFDGTGDYLTLDGSADFHFGTSDWTMDFWLRLSVATGIHNLVDFKPNTTGAVYPQIYVSSGTIIYRVNGADRISGATLAAGTWYHIAVAKSAGNTKMFIDGVQSGSTYADANDYLAPAANRPVIGANAGLADSLNGWLDEFRISKGIARWTANFTPPVGPYSITAYSSNFVYNTTTDLYSPTFSSGTTVQINARISDLTPADSYTFIDRTTALVAGQVVSKIGVYATGAGTHTVKIVKRNSANNYDVVVNQTVSHPGGGWVDFTLTSPYTVPGTGTYYLGDYVPVGTANTSTTGSVARTYYVGSLTGIGVTTAGEDTASVYPLRYVHSMLPNNMTLQTISRTFPAGTPKAARLLVGIIENEAITVNTHFLAKLSRDGTTWKTVDLSYSHTDGSTKYYVAANENLQSGAGSGSNLIAKFETAGNKNIDVSGYDLRAVA